MSWVANVMLSVVHDDVPTANEFAAWVSAQCPRRSGAVHGGVGGLADVTGEHTPWGGYKMPECVVYAGALNHADLGALVEYFGAIQWRHPAAAQLFVMDQEELFFRLWMIRDGRVQQYAPSQPSEDDDEFWPPVDPQHSPPPHASGPA